MDKNFLHDILKGFIVTCRKNAAVICLGYTDAPENFLQYSPEKENKLLTILNAYNISAKKEIKKDYKYHCVSYRIIF